MDRYEEAVMDYITGSGQRFVNPQFSIPYKDGQGGSLPDYVVIDYEDKTIYVVEVTKAWDTSTLLERVEQRESRWFLPLKGHLEGLSNEFCNWELRVTLFVRKDRNEYVRNKIANQDDVAVFSIEDISFPYSWEWEGNEPKNPLK